MGDGGLGVVMIGCTVRLDVIGVDWIGLKYVRLDLILFG